MRKSTCSHSTAQHEQHDGCTGVLQRRCPTAAALSSTLLRCTRVPPDMPMTLMAEAASVIAVTAGRMGQQTIDHDGDHTGEAQPHADPLQLGQTFAEHPARRQRGEHRMQPGDQRADPRRQAAVDGDEHPAEVEHVHAEPGEHDPRHEPASRLAGAVRIAATPARAPGGQHHAHRQKRERTGVVGGVASGDEAGAPQHHEDPWRRGSNARRAGRRSDPPFHDSESDGDGQAPPSVSVTVHGREARAVDVDALGLQLLDRLVDDVVGVRRRVGRLGQHRLAIEVLGLAGNLGRAVPRGLIDDTDADRSTARSAC